MKSVIAEKIKETLVSVLPITAIVVLLKVFFVKEMPMDMFYALLIGVFFLCIGFFLFSLGTDMGMLPMGEMLGEGITKINKRTLAILICFLIGVLVTVAELDLHVLAMQVTSSSIEVFTFVFVVGFGVGMFLVMALLKLVFKLKIKYILSISYGLIFLLTIFANRNFIPVAFDASGATTGPITVPFIMALGAGLASISGSKNTEEDSFGLIGICSIGPIFSVLLLGFFYDFGYTEDVVQTIGGGFWSVLGSFFMKLPSYMLEVFISLIPILVFFTVYQLIKRKITKRRIVKLIVGILYTYFGIVLFLTGANAGFVPAGRFFGESLGAIDYNWILIIIGFIIGIAIILAEPAVHILNNQVEEITGGAIPKKTMFISLALGEGISVALNMVRVLYHINILYFLIPGFGLAIILGFFVPNIFTSIAFDSGGVAAGTMSGAFIVPFSIGVCTAVGGNMMQDGLGAIGIIAMTPILTIQLVGLIYKLKSRTKKIKHRKKSKHNKLDEQIIEIGD